MPRDVICPHCQTTLRLDEVPPSALGTDDTPIDIGMTVETVIPSTVCVDEMLGIPPELEGFLAGDAAHAAAPLAPIHAPHRPNGSGSKSPPRELLHSPDPETIPTLLGPGSSDELDVTRGPSQAPAGLDGAAIVASSKPDIATVSNPRGRVGQVSTSGLILLLYSGAVTCALIWQIWRGQSRAAEVSNTPETRLANAMDGDDAAARTRFLNSLPKLPADRTIPLNQTARFDDIEITPLAVEAGTVSLEHALNGEFRDGGTGALFLRLRLKNLSADATFAPLTPELIRRPDRGLPDAVLVSNAGDLVLPYNLAVQSEWSITGQSLQPFAPEEERETTIVSDKEASVQKNADLTWRFRINTGPGKSALIGVRFNESEIH